MLPRWSTHPCGSQHNIKQFYQNTATLLKPSLISDCVNSMQRVKFRNRRRQMRIIQRGGTLKVECASRQSVRGVSGLQ